VNVGERGDFHASTITRIDEATGGAAAEPSPARRGRYSFRAIQESSRPADIASRRSTHPETAMYRFPTTMMIFALAAGLSQAAETAPSVVVRFPDLDLSRSASVAVLYQRLQGAAETVCAPLDDSDLPRHMRFKACVQGAISMAVAKADQPALTAYYRTKTKGPSAAVQVAQK
jgi:UrcA family protein